MKKSFFTLSLLTILSLFFVSILFTGQQKTKHSKKLKSQKTKVVKPQQSGKQGTHEVMILDFEDFESPTFPPTGWTIGNPDLSTTWVRSSFASGFGIGDASAYVNNYNYDAPGAKDTLSTAVLTGLVFGDSLKFDVAYEKYTGSAESLKIVISTNGGASFSQIYKKGGTLLATAPTTDEEFTPTPSQWRTERVALPSGVTGNNVIIAFINICDFGNNLYIDNIRIGSSPQKDLNVTNVDLQPTPLVAGSSAQVKALLRWDGVDSLRPTSARFVYKTGSAPTDSNDGISQRLSITWSPITPRTSTVAFSTPYTPLQPGTFEMYVRAFLEGDGFGENDVSSKNFYATFVVTTFPYLENFDGTSDSGWTTSAINGPNDWIRATPKKSQIDTAHSGTKSWITSDSLPYSDDANHYVLSPIFNFSGFTADPVLNIYHNYITEGGLDGGTIEYSFDGINFNVLGEFEDIDGYNWYDNEDPIGGEPIKLDGANWSGSSEYLENPDSGWINSYVPMRGFAGKTNVQVRFRFVSDEGITDEGWAFDDVYIYRSSSIAGNIFEDINGNGIKELGEPPMEDAEINITGALERTIYTDANGDYIFSYLKPGNYTVALTPNDNIFYTFPESPIPQYNVTLTGNEVTGKDFGIFYYGRISGSKYLDSLGNRTRDLSDRGLPNWRIVLSGPLNDTLTTDSLGNFLFDSLLAGAYTISEIQEEGYSQSVPAYPGKYQMNILSGNNYPNTDFGNGQFGAIAGKVYEDFNANGIQDTNDDGLGGWKVYLNGVISDSVLSDVNGYFSFLPLPLGQYTISTENKAGFIFTAPATISDTVDILANGTIENINFGRFELGSISGTKFEDENGNGAKDNGELGIPDWKIKLDNGNFLLTDEQGNYSFTGLEFGEYEVSESLKTGWTQTFPEDITYSISISSGTHSLENDFGNFKNGVIEGKKFEDLNANAVMDTNDIRLAGWQIAYTNGTQSGSMATNDSGNYSFTNLGPGTYTVSEQTVANYHQSLPGGDETYEFLLTSGDTVRNMDFGNYRFGSIAGKAYLDKNVNGILNDNENGLENWVLKIQSGDSTITDTSGNYTFDELIPGNYTLTQVLPPTWTNTDPDTGDYEITIISNQHIGDKNFGNYQKGSISGYVYLDSLADAAKDTSDAGIAGWKVYLNSIQYGSDSTTTDAEGRYIFPNLILAEYTVSSTAQDPSFYFSEPKTAMYTDSITSGLHITEHNFGVYQLGEVSGFVFSDKNKNGIKEGNERGLAAWQVKLTGLISDSILTDTSGYYSFTDLTPGVYALAEVIQNDAIQTSPSDTIYTITLHSGETRSALNFGNYADTSTFRTLKLELALSQKATKLKQRRGQPKPVPTVANARDTIFKRIPNKAGIVLGYSQTTKILAKQYSWIRWKKGSDFAKFYSESHDAALPYVFDSLRVAGKKTKKMSKEYKASAKKYKNPLAAQYGVFKLNIEGSIRGITPPFFGTLKYVGSESLWTGKTLTEMANSIDSILTYYAIKQVDTSELRKLVAVLDTINKAFYVTADSFNTSYPPLAFNGKIKLQDVPFLTSSSEKPVPLNRQPSSMGVPENFTLEQNYPNPFNPQTVIGFSLLDVGNVTLKIYNVLGQEVATLLNNEAMEEGEHEIQFDASRLTSGVYFYRINVERSGASFYTSVKKMMLMK